MDADNWELLWLPIFRKRVDRFEKYVLKKKKQDPANYYTHISAVHLKRLYKTILEDVPSSPDDKKYSIGNLLGSKYTIFRRVKNIPKKRDRLFFSFASSENKIIYAWLNDEKTVRREGDHNDVYAVFKRILDSGKIPHTINELISSSANIVIKAKELLSTT